MNLENSGTPVFTCYIFYFFKESECYDASVTSGNGFMYGHF